MARQHKHRMVLEMHTDPYPSQGSIREVPPGTALESMGLEMHLKWMKYIQFMNQLVRHILDMLTNKSV